MDTDYLTVVLWYIAACITVCIVVLGGFYIAELKGCFTESDKQRKKAKVHQVLITLVFVLIVLIDGALLLFNYFSVYDLF